MNTEIVRSFEQTFCRYCCLHTSEELIDVCDCIGTAKMHFSCVRHKIICSADAKCIYCGTHFRDNRIKRYRRTVAVTEEKDKRMTRFIAIVALLWFAFQIYSSNVLNEGIKEVTVSSSQECSRFVKPMSCSIDPNNKCPKCLEIYRRIRSKGLNRKDLCGQCLASFEDIVNPQICPLCRTGGKRKAVWRSTKKDIMTFRPSSTFSTLILFSKPLVILAFGYALLRHIKNSSRDWMTEQFEDCKVVSLESCVNGKGQRLRRLRLFIKDDKVFVQQIEDSLPSHNSRH